MKLPVDLAEVSREELIEIIGQLISLIEAQEARIAELEGQQKAPTEGGKERKPPSWVKANRPDRLTGVCKGFSRRGMVCDLQVGLGFRPGFGQRPDAAPEAALEQQAPEPVDAVADHADGARRTAPRVPVMGSQRFGRRPQIAWGNLAVLGVFDPGAVGQGQQRRHRQRQPVAGDACRVGAPGLVPLPAQALEGLAAQFDPAAQRVPTDADFLGRQVGEDDQGSSCSAYQTTMRVQRRWALGVLKAVP